MSRIIYNRWIPPRRFAAINLFGFIFARPGIRFTPQMLNHELIHTHQQREMLYIFFYLWYLVEWLVHYARLRDGIRAYMAISFEREAYLHDHDLSYLQHRRHYAWGRKRL